MTDTRVHQTGAEVLQTDTAATRVHQSGAEVLQTDAPSARVLQFGVEVILNENAIRVDGLAGPRALGTWFLGNSFPVPGLAGPRALGAHSIPTVLQISSLIGTLSIGGAAYVIDSKTMILPSLLGPRALGNTKFAPTFAVPSLIHAHAISNGMILRDPRWIIGVGLLGPRLLGIHDIHVVDPPRTLTLRVVGVEYGPPGIISAQCVEEDIQNYPNAGLVGGSPAPGSQQKVAPLPGSSKLFLVDSVTLRDNDDGLGPHFAVSGFSPNWRGAFVEKSTDSGQTWQELLTITEEAALGYAVTALGTVSRPEDWDRVNSVTIQLIRSDLYQLFTDSEINVLNGANAGALIKSNGEAEIFQWTTAVAVGTGRYQLSGLLRGRRGSEYAVSGHAIEDRFALLVAGDLSALPANLNDVGVARLYRATSLGANQIETITQSFTFTAASLKPLAPAHIVGSRDGSNNLTITWKRRTRINQEWRDSVDVPLSEGSESYQVDIFNGPTIVRTISTTVQSASYTAAQQTADGLTPGNPVVMKIYQISAVVGRGFASSATV